MNKYTYEIINDRRLGTIQTAHGPIHTPAFFPVTTFGDIFPLEKLVQPYLKRLSQCVMVSHYYAKQMKQRPEMPLFIDSGGFASLFDGSDIVEHNGCASIKTKEGKKIHPLEVLEFQEQNADIASTLDFVIPPDMDIHEAKRRQRHTIQNAFYALKQKRSKSLVLYASLQCWDKKSAKLCAKEYANSGFDGIAIGGIVPRIRDYNYIESIVTSIREEAPDLPIHVFGAGHKNILKTLWKLGVDTTDSSSYIRNAVGSDKSPIIHYANYKILCGPHKPLLLAIDNLQTILHTQKEYLNEKIPIIS